MTLTVRTGLFIVLVTAVVGAQPQTISLNRAVQIALEQNFAIKQAANNVERDQAGVLSAYGNFVPTVNLNSSWSGGEQYVNGVALGSSDVRSLSMGVSARMTIFDGFANTSSFTSASATASASEYTLGRTRQTVSSQAQRLYYEVLRTRKLLEVAKLNLDYSSKQLDRVKETARLGSASLVNVYQQQSQVGSDEVRLVQAQNDYDLAHSNLAAYLALDMLQDYTIEDPAIPNEIDSVEMVRFRALTADLRSVANEAFERRPDYRSARESFRATQASVTAARSGYFPTLSASASYGFNGRTILDAPASSAIIHQNAGGTVNHLIVPISSRSYSSEFSNFKDNASLNWSLSLSLPIFSGFKTNESVQRALVAEKNAEEGLRESERRIMVELKTAALQLGAAVKSYEAAQKSYQFQEQNLKVNQEKYNVGSGTLLDLLFAQNNYTNALVTRINAVYQYLNAKSQFELAVGSLPQ